MYRVIRFVDRLTDYALLVFFLILFVIGGYTMYDTMLIYGSAGGEDMRSFKPLQTQSDGSDAIVWDMSALSEDVVAWLTVDGTTIDYPVMQGVDNNEYLNKDPFGAFSLAGSIFLDSRNASDFSDDYSLIYGHHMEYGRMFGALDEFVDEAYFDDHLTGTLVVADKAYDICFFACLECDASVDEVFAPTETDGTLAYVLANASILRDYEDGPLIALSTCKFPQTTERIVVFGVLQYDE